MQRIALLFILIFSFPGLEAKEVDFSHDVVPILKEHCSDCHGGEEAKGGFSINTRELFLDDETAIPGKSAKSYFLELIEDDDPEYQMPPEKKPRVAPEQIAILKQWIDQGMKWEPGFTFGTPVYEPPFAPRRPDLPPARDGRTHPIDRFIDAYLVENNLEHPDPVDEATFLRRVSLDLTGLLPSPDFVRSYLAYEDPGKRTKLVDKLLEDDLAYTEHWLTFWNDLLRNDYDGTGFITKGRTQISEWLHTSLKQNKPFDTMVRELIAPPTPASAGFINGIKWRGTVSAGQTLPIQFSQSISQSFLGINMKCASCHDSFIDRWTLADAYSLAAVYSDQPLELHRCDKPTGEMAKAAWIFPEIGEIDASKPKNERLKQLAELMTHPENGRVPRTIVNRLWGQMMGHGLVHPLDAMQTEPWHPDLLDWLAADFQENGYDLKHTLRMIATSSAYQSRTRIHETEDETGPYTFDGPRPKRLTAEQFVDAIWQITGDAPTKFDAPVSRSIVAPESGKENTLKSNWIWGPSAAPGPPPHGEKILLRREFSPSSKVSTAAVVATVDNAFTLYLNGKKVLAGTNWEELNSASVTKHISTGKNTLLIVAENAGTSPNAAGAFCAVRLEYEDGSEEVIVTDESWQVSETIPSGSDARQWDLASLKWSKVLPVSVDVWKKSTDNRIGPALASASAGKPQYQVRAALLKANELMRALGRPNRDQIVTSRPSELTTLEAVNLATSEELVRNLKRGAQQFSGMESTTKLIEEIYLTTLSRLPTEPERSLLSQNIGTNPTEETITDLLWALTMTPEFFLIR